MKSATPIDRIVLADLLAVCEDTLTKLEYLQGEGIVQMPRTIELLKAAIAKAKGE